MMVISLEELIEIAENSSREFTIVTQPDMPEWLGNSATIHYIDSNAFCRGLDDLLDRKRLEID